MAKFKWAFGCLLASLIFCAVTHAAVCVTALHSNKTKIKIMGTLFGLQSLGCMALTVYAGVHMMKYAKAGRKKRTSAWSLHSDSARYLENSADVDAMDEALTEQWHFPHTNSFPLASLEGSGCWTWLFVLIVGGVDVLWALCGVRSLWFVATLGHIPSGTQGPTAALVVGVVVCTVLLSMSPAMSTATWLDLRGLVEVGCALLPSLLLLAQLASAGAPPQISRAHSSVCHSPLGSPPRSRHKGFMPRSSTVQESMSMSMSLKDRRIRQSVHKPLRYSVSKQIASGGFSDVCLGLSHDTGELICVKQLKTGFAESDIANMETEVSLLKRLAHPNIVQYLGTDRGERFTILLGYVPGGSIALLLSQFGALEEELVTLYVRQAVWGLEYLHSEGIVHGDIKGANILVSDKGEVRLTDFGCSYCSRSADRNCLVMGTVLWMAPEVCRQEGSNWSCDIWSLGCTILQMATNQEPWSEMQFEHTIPAFYHIATCQQPPQVPDTLCGPMHDVVRQCLQLEASRRPTCNELLATPWLALDVDGTDSRTSYSMASPRWSRLQAEESSTMAQGNAGPSQGNSNDLLKNVPPYLPLPGRLPTSRSASPTPFWPPSNVSGLPLRAHPVDRGTVSHVVLPCQMSDAVLGVHQGLRAPSRLPPHCKMQSLVDETGLTTTSVSFPPPSRPLPHARDGYWPLSGGPAHQPGWTSRRRPSELSTSAGAPSGQIAGTQSMSALYRFCPSDDMPRSASGSIPRFRRSPALSYVVSLPRSAARKVSVEGTPSMLALSSHRSDDAPPSGSTFHNSDGGRPARGGSWRNQLAKQLEFLSTIRAIDCEQPSDMEPQAQRATPRAPQDQGFP